MQNGNSGHMFAMNVGFTLILVLGFLGVSPQVVAGLIGLLIVGSWVYLTCHKK